MNRRLASIPKRGVNFGIKSIIWRLKGITVLVSTHYMDEAERCHELVYIAYGKILARGTENEIIDQSKLKVWTLQGQQLGRFLEPPETSRRC